MIGRYAGLIWTHQLYMIAKYSSYTEARAYTWPVLEEHPPFESPVGLSPPLIRNPVSIFSLTC